MCNLLRVCLSRLRAPGGAHWRPMRRMTVQEGPVTTNATMPAGSSVCRIHTCKPSPVPFMRRIVSIFISISHTVSMHGHFSLTLPFALWDFPLRYFPSQFCCLRIVLLCMALYCFVWPCIALYDILWHGRVRGSSGEPQSPGDVPPRGPTRPSHRPQCGVRGHRSRWKGLAVSIMN